MFSQEKQHLQVLSSIKQMRAPWIYPLTLPDNASHLCQTWQHEFLGLHKLKELRDHLD